MKALLYLFLLLTPLSLVYADVAYVELINGSKTVYSGEKFHIFVRLHVEGEEQEKNTNPQILAPNDTDDYKVEISTNPYVLSTGRIQMSGDKTIFHKETAYSWDAWITSTSTNDIENLVFQIEYNEEKYEGTLPTVKVLSPQNSPYAEIEFFVNKNNIICEDTFTLTSKITLRAVSDGQSIFSPIPMHRKLELIMPHLNEYPETLELIAGGRNELIHNYHVDYGLKINNYPHSMNARNMVPFSFELPNSTTNINGTTYITYSWTTIYKAKKPGKITFQPTSLQGHILSISSNGVESLNEIYIQSKPVTITISHPPLENRPQNFIGAISNTFNVDTRLDTITCKEGDPITLTIEITGVENPLSVTPPDLDKISNFSNNFRAFGSILTTPSEEDNSIKFEYNLRPIVYGTIEFPAIELSYFNINSNSYVSYTTTPIPLRVNPAPQIATTETLSEPNAVANDFHDNRYFPTAISFNTTDIAQTNTSRNIIALAIFAPFIWLTILIIKSINSNKQRIKNKIKDFSIFNTLENKIQSAKTPQDIMAAILSLLKHKFNYKSSGLTPNDIEKILKEEKVDPQTIAEIYTPLNHIFNLSFSPNADISSEIAIAKNKIIPSIQKLNTKPNSLGKNFLGISILIGLVIIILLPISMALLMYFNLPQESNKAHQDSFDILQANILINSATTKDDFAIVANTYYEKLNLENGCSSPTILHNYATILTLSGNPQKAIEVIEYIETITGATKELNNSLLFALQTQQELDNFAINEENRTIIEAPTLPWYRTTLFWHYNYSIFTRGNALGIIWSLFWFVLIIYMFAQKKKLLKISLVIIILAFVCTSSSYTISRMKLNKPIPNLVIDNDKSSVNTNSEGGLKNE